jgi:hypothetical protein
MKNRKMDRHILLLRFVDALLPLSRLFCLGKEKVLFSFAIHWLFPLGDPKRDCYRLPSSGQGPDYCYSLMAPGLPPYRRILTAYLPKPALQTLRPRPSCPNLLAQIFWPRLSGPGPLFFLAIWRVKRLAGGSRRPDRLSKGQSSDGEAN